MSLPWSWGATADEVLAAATAVKGRAMIRAVTVHAPARVVFRWLCQLKVAPYSYDLLDNRARRSPRTLTPGAEVLTVGEPVMRIFTLEDYVRNRSITLRMTDAGALRLFGPMTVTYRVSDVPGGSRLTCLIDLLSNNGLRSRVRRWALAWGDLVMMRKQLLTIRDLSQQDGSQRPG